MKAIDKSHEKRKAIEKDLKQKMMLFDKLPDHCLACEKEFDKEDIEQISTWTVVVRKEQNIVRLYCPDCIKKAKTVVEDYERKRTENRNLSNSEQK